MARSGRPTETPRLPMMPNGWYVGQLGGIEIRLDFSLSLLGLLVTLMLAWRLFPAIVPGYAPLVYLITGVFTAGVFIASVLWHEMAHALVAQRYGIPVVRIVLHLYGGVAYLGRDPERPHQEFWIAAAGPLSSLALAVMFGFISGLSGLSGAASGFLATINLMLALFNLLPGFPLDGGRILRAAIWHFGGSYRRATRTASRIGQGMAGLFVLLGVFIFLSDDLIDGLWMLLIAWFLYNAATMSFRMTGSGPMPMGESVRRVMRVNVPVITPDERLALLAWRYLDHARDQAFPVMQNGQLVGMITVAEASQVPRLDWGKVRVGQIMLPREKLIIISPHDSLERAMTALDGAGLNHAPVIEHNMLIGMLNRRDIVYRT